MKSRLRFQSLKKPLSVPKVVDRPRLARHTVGIWKSGSVDWVSARPAADWAEPLAITHAGMPVKVPLVTTSICVPRGPHPVTPVWPWPVEKPLFENALEKYTAGSPPVKRPTPPLICVFEKNPSL